MKYAKYDVQYLRHGTWSLNKRFDYLADAEKRFESGAENWLGTGAFSSDADRIRKVTLQETYETVRQTEPPAAVDPPVWSSWEDLLKASRELNAAEERLASLHVQLRVKVVTAGDRGPVEAAIANQENLVDDLNIQVLQHARKLGRDVPEPPAERFEVQIFHDGEWHPDQPGGFVTEAAAASQYEHMVRRWLGAGGITGIRLLKDGMAIRGTYTDRKD